MASNRHLLGYRGLLNLSFSCIAYLTDKIKRLQPSRSLRACDGYKAIVPQANKVHLGVRWDRSVICLCSTFYLRES